MDKRAFLNGEQSAARYFSKVVIYLHNSKTGICWQLYYTNCEIHEYILYKAYQYQKL